MTPAPAPSRDRLLHDALRLEYVTVGWNLIEGAVAVTAAIVAHSIALLGFGLDSFVETASTLALTACWWLSLITLGGIGLNLLLGGWWADPVAALAMTGFLVAEGRKAWRGEDCGCDWSRSRAARAPVARTARLLYTKEPSGFHDPPRGTS
jgi:hypothetical protein